MLRILSGLLLSVLIVSSVHAQAFPKAMEAVRASDWTEAKRLVRRQDEAVQDIVEWHRLRAGVGTPQEAIAFLSRRADWPGLPYLRRQMEGAFDEASTSQVLAFFDNQDARTAEGALIKARALQSQGRRGGRGRYRFSLAHHVDVRGRAVCVSGRL